MVVRLLFIFDIGRTPERFNFPPVTRAGGSDHALRAIPDRAEAPPSTRRRLLFAAPALPEQALVSIELAGVKAGFLRAPVGDKCGSIVPPGRRRARRRVVRR